jgi:flavin reductase (DIM6/NTAB) family NADH-FMN oxidoreductase RutF
MFYRPGLDPHGLAHNPFKALIAPRPIGWISTLDADGRANLAPYSFFNAIADTPPLVMYANTGGKTSDGSRKDTLANIRATGEFVHHVVPFALRDAMNRSSGPYPAGADEFEIAGLNKAPSTIVAPPRVANVPAAMECRVWRIIDLPGADNHMVIAEVVGIHIDASVLMDGKVDVTRYRPVARLGYRDYASVDEVFAMTRPVGG